MKKLRITVDGKAYDVTVEVLDSPSTTLPAPVAAPIAAAAAPPPAPAGEGAIVSPLAGKVISIDVKIGDKITSGSQVATVEAMKMNTFIYAEQSGQVAAILVSPGDVVEEGGAILSLA
jgi:biotin carboxyl carrier protein